MAVRSTTDYFGTFTMNNFISQGGGVYTFTVLAENHGLSNNYRVSKITRTDANSAQQPVLCDYTIAANGDFTITANERFNGCYYLSVGG